MINTIFWVSKTSIPPSTTMVILVIFVIRIPQIPTTTSSAPITPLIFPIIPSIGPIIPSICPIVPFRLVFPIIPIISPIVPVRFVFPIIPFISPVVPSRSISYSDEVGCVPAEDWNPKILSKLEKCGGTQTRSTRTQLHHYHLPNCPIHIHHCRYRLPSPNCSIRLPNSIPMLLYIQN